jgi:hypothetical protein
MDDVSCQFFPFVSQALINLILLQEAGYKFCIQEQTHMPAPDAVNK